MATPRNHDGNSLAGSWIAITPADENLATAPCMGLYVGTGGTIVAIDASGNTATFANVPDSTFLPIKAVQVKAASTATDIVALY